ncbi:MAG: glycosyltransferase family 4 protein [Prevotellaceae bacterium]|jgi:glycosyltransferase involved in cell wall biosynthesis|nr:glycosyltransferase family 4 protein [Prevotellaceae bacterium]
MRILLVNTSERIGGAAVAAVRLMEALTDNGIKAKLLVRDKQTEEISVVPLDRSRRLLWKFVWERIVIWRANHFKKHQLFAVDIANTGTDITTLPEFKQADVIHLHWVNQGMLSLKNIDKILASGKPVVWTMHDMWAATGICHHSRECNRYEQGCHHCPFLWSGGGKRDLSYRTFRKKQKLYQGRKIYFVACSQWLAERARKSALLIGQPVVSIPNPINIHLFKPGNKQEARRACQLPEAGKLILFGSVKTTDKRKGIDYLVEACRLLAEQHPELTEHLGVVVLGNQSRRLEQLLPLKTYPLDFVIDEHRLVDIYNAVDGYVTPSLEENLPNTIMEAMSCGVPCVGFRTGGIPEMIDHLHNGYVADYRSAQDFADGIHRLLTDPDNDTLAEQAYRKAASCYSESVVAKRYIELYNKITGTHV